MFSHVRLFFEICSFDRPSSDLLDDETRVKLKGTSDDYINANHVQVPSAKRRYILTQVERTKDRRTDCKSDFRDLWRTLANISGRWSGNRTAE